MPIACPLCMHLFVYAYLGLWHRGYSWFPGGSLSRPSLGEFSVRFYATAFNEWAIYVKYTCSHWIPLHIPFHSHTHTQSERETAEDSHTCTHKRHLQKMSVANTQTDTRTTRGRACMPHNNKNLFSTFYLSQPAVAPLPPATSRRRHAALQSEQAYNIPLLQSSVLLGLVVMCIRIHIIITHSPRCTAEGILASTQLERTEQNRTERNKIASENKNTTCHTPMPPSPRLCSVNCVQLFCCSCKRTNMCV